MSKDGDLKTTYAINDSKCSNTIVIKYVIDRNYLDYSMSPIVGV